MRTFTIQVGMSVTHKDPAGMQGATGIVLAEAGLRYKRRYLWVNYTTRKTATKPSRTFNSAFWDEVLVKSSKKTIVYPPTVDFPENFTIL